MSERTERRSVEVKKTHGSANVESSDRGELATEAYLDSRGQWVAAINIESGPISASTVLEEDAARELKEDLCDYLALMRVENDSEDTDIEGVNPGP